MHFEVRSAPNRVFQDRTALEPATRRLNGASRGFQTVHLAGPNSGISFWGVRRPRAGISAMFPPRPRAGGKSACFGRVLGAKQKQLPSKTPQNDTRVSSASLISPVRWGYYDLPARGRARWTKITPAREGRAKPERRATNSNKMAHVHSPLPRYHSYGRERC